MQIAYMITRFSVVLQIHWKSARNCSGAAKHHRKAYETWIAPKKNCTGHRNDCRTRCPKSPSCWMAFLHTKLAA